MGNSMVKYFYIIPLIYNVKSTAVNAARYVLLVSDVFTA